MMYYHENNDDYKFILMWFIDVHGEVHGVISTEHDRDNNCTSNVCEDHGKSFLILKSYQNWMTYEVNCSICWHNFVYDFLMLHVCYIYCDILNYDATISHHTHMHISIVNFCCIHFEIILNISSICYTFNNTIHTSYLCKL